MVTTKTFLEKLNFSNSLFINKQFVKPNYPLKGIEDILHRDDEINTFFDYVKDIFRNVSPNNIFIYGKPGLGKTIITERVLEEVQKEAYNRNIKLCVINIKCDGTKSAHGIIKKCNEELPTPVGEEKRKLANSLSDQINYFEHIVNNYEGMILIVLDEFDKATNPEIINEIIRIRSKKSEQFPCVICITNDLTVREKLPPQLKSVLCENTLMIKPYDADQLLDIINARIKIAFKPNTVGEMVTPLCAAFAAQEHGDARRAIDLLRVAGEIAEEKNKEIVEETDVRDAKIKIEEDKIVEAVKSLPIQSKTTLLACIYISDLKIESSTSNIYLLYKKLCLEIDLDFLTLRSISSFLDEMEQLSIIVSENKNLGRYGRKRLVLQITSKDRVKKILYQDDRLSFLIDTDPKKYLHWLQLMNL
jgi:cell division control protein 6